MRHTEKDNTASQNTLRLHMECACKSPFLLNSFLSATYVERENQSANGQDDASFANKTYVASAQDWNTRNYTARDMYLPFQLWKSQNDAAS